MRTPFFYLIYIVLGTIPVFGQNSNRVITTGVPFLLITSDARAAGYG